jgi:OOP family OmpA-OmpF porin
MKKILLLLMLTFVALPALAQELQRFNIGTSINTNCDEINPVISADGKTLYFCRSQCDLNIGVEDIWYSKLGANGKWSEPENMGEPLNNGGSNFVSSISADGNTLLLGSIYDEESFFKEGVSLTHRGDVGWTFPEKVKINEFYNMDKHNGFALSDDGSVLLMTVQRHDTYGQKDIYVSFLRDDNTYSTPVNLGDVVNTSGDELSPYIAADGVTLYFSSKGHQGYGDADIFMTKRLDATWQNWSEPVNLGPGINTPGWDAHLKVTAKGDVAYFSSNYKTNGKSDIFTAEMPLDKRPQKVVLVKGMVTSAKSKAPLSAKVVYEDVNGNMVGVTNTNPATGEYALTLSPIPQYRIFVSRNGFLEYTDTIDLSEIEEIEEIVRNFRLVPETDSLILVPNLLFSKNRTNPSLEEESAIKDLVRFLTDNEGYFLKIFGHADSTGSEEINIKISQDRANAAAEIIKKYGLADNKIIIIPKGEGEPVASNNTESGRALNRRVEFIISKRE